MRTKTKVKLVLGTALAISLGIAGYTGYKAAKKAYHRFQYERSPTLEPTSADSREKGGLELGEFKVTTYNTAKEQNYRNWSATGEVLSGPEACKVNNKGFYEAVRCEGAGIGINGLLYTAGSIKPEKKESHGEKVSPKCPGYVAYRKGCVAVGKSLAVDPNIIPYGTLVKLKFLNNDGTPCKTDVCNLFSGWGYAEDTGGSIKGNRIDYYAGLELGKTKDGKIFYLGQDLPSRAIIYIAKKDKDTVLEEILKNRSPRLRSEYYIKAKKLIAKNNPTPQKKPTQKKDSKRKL